MIWFILVSTYLVLSLCIHAVVCHTIKKGTVFSKFLIVGTVVGCALLANLYCLYGFGVELITGALAYAFVSELYIFTFTFISSSISVSILLKVSTGAIEISDLSKEYCGKTMVDNRLRRMRDVGLFIEMNNSLQLSKSGDNLVERFNKLQCFFRLNKATI